MASKAEILQQSFAISDSSHPLHLKHCQEYIEVLKDIIEPDGEDIVLAIFADDQAVELPKELAPKLWTLVQRLISIARFGDRYFITQEP